jgi:hypothetical protein
VTGIAGDSVVRRVAHYLSSLFLSIAPLLGIRLSATATTMKTTTTTTNDKTGAVSAIATPSVQHLVRQGIRRHGTVGIRRPGGLAVRNGTTKMPRHQQSAKFATRKKDGHALFE